MSYVYCSVCSRKVNVESGHFIEHKNKRGRVCYGSFTPAQDINPFKRQRRLVAEARLNELESELSAVGDALVDDALDDGDFIRQLREMA